MTIKEYSNKINNLRVDEISQFSDDTDLENAVLKVLQDMNGNYFTIETLFDQSAESVILNSEIVQLFTDCLSLLFSSEKETGNICFANSSELRPEFRQTFTAIELLDYVYAFAYSSFYKEFQKIAITSEADVFWKLVKIGAGLRKENK
ncbi:hypothetical protein [Flavobacterium hydrophilum]|uniref:Uncharacterized protein n=1 Tax=Flavobacterium hydrophilum TaxID=2211445 RepID=A0A2V4C6R3_9FLAO|nr:hypothetical protein [Flavobacterium hydrophilum]PXY47028.1 hypothetical protein DMB68_07735 [Flavobacterium hydrophilum]